MSHRKKCRTKNKIGLAEKIHMVHQVLHQHISVQSVAKEHRVTSACVSNLVKLCNKNHNLLRELVAAREESELMKEEACGAIVNMYQRGNYLSSIKCIQAKLLEDHDIRIKPWTLMHLLHHQLGMKYKKVKEVSW